MIGYIKMLNSFPQDLAEKASEISSELVETFDYIPTTLEEDYKKRKQWMKAADTASNPSVY